MIRMILAVDRGNAIGWTDGRLPWKLPEDMKRFKTLTSDPQANGGVVMGYNTFISLNRPDGLPNRLNAVLTRRNPLDLRGKTGDKVRIISDLARWCKQWAEHDDQHIWIIGGASVYDEAISTGLVEEIYLTLVDENSGADVILKHDLAAWKRFVLEQQKLGIKWVAEPEFPILPEGHPNITYITLKKQ